MNDENVLHLLRSLTGEKCLVYAVCSTNQELNKTSQS